MKVMKKEFSTTRYLVEYNQDFEPPVSVHVTDHPKRQISIFLYNDRMERIPTIDVSKEAAQALVMALEAALDHLADTS